MEVCKFEKCTGCGMCADVCPKGCISIKHDKHGFYRSYVDNSRCINCHRCADTCPANHPSNVNHIQKAYKARRTDKAASVKSSSGGVAAVISEYIIKNSGVVAGCGFDDKILLKHSIASGAEELECFKGSKYLQSYTVGIYRQVREQLKTGKQVLFIGTPCQASALKNFLGKDYDNLFVVDFVCHGVLSQAVFDKYIDSLNQKDAPISVEFRNKTKGYRDKIACFEMQVEYPNKIIRNTQQAGIYRWFASGLGNRESCYDCSFVSVNRASDITLADYIGNDLDDTDNEVGVSTVFVNSDKGAALLEAIKSEIVTQPRDAVGTAKLYTRMITGERMPKCRKVFFEELFTCDYSTLAKKYDTQAILPGKMSRRYRALQMRIRKFLIK